MSVSNSLCRSFIKPGWERKRMCILLNSILSQLLSHFLTIVISKGLMKLHVLVQVTFLRIHLLLLQLLLFQKSPDFIPIYRRGVYNTTVHRKPVSWNYRKGYIQVEIIIAIRNILHNWEMRCSTWKVTKRACWGCSDRSRKAENRLYGWDGAIYSVVPEIGISCRQTDSKGMSQKGFRCSLG